MSLPRAQQVDRSRCDQIKNTIMPFLSFRGTQCSRRLLPVSALVVASSGNVLWQLLAHPSRQRPSLPCSKLGDQLTKPERIEADSRSRVVRVSAPAAVTRIIMTHLCHQSASHRHD